MSTKEIGFTKESEHGKKGFGGANFVLKKLESVGKGVADGPAESTQAERVEKSFGLIANAGGAVLEVAVIKAEAGIDPDGVNAGLKGAIDLAAKIIEESGGVVRGVKKVTDGADILSLDVTENDARTMLSDAAIDIIGRARARQVENGGAGFEATARDGWVVSLDGDE